MVGQWYQCAGIDRRLSALTLDRFANQHEQATHRHT